MRAVMIHPPGNLRLDDIAEPAPGPQEVLVEVEFGGICGSDLHYWRQGAAGTSVLRDPMVLGHEIAGTVADTGPGVDRSVIGRRVTVHPGTSCGGCAECRSGLTNLCTDMSYFGSAAHRPHTAGAFARRRVAPLSQVVFLPDELSTRHAAAAEPLGVAVHAVHRAGDVRGKRVLVNGVGPIGCLVVAAAKALGAAEVHAADLAAGSLNIALAMGADNAVQVGTDQRLPQDVDITYEVSGAPAALGPCMSATRRGGTLVQVGMLPPGPVTAELAALVSREITYVGSFRFIGEITEAVDLLAGTIDVEPLLTHTFPVTEVTTAFTTALDRSIAGKVLLDFTSGTGAPSDLMPCSHG